MLDLVRIDTTMAIPGHLVLRQLREQSAAKAYFVEQFSFLDQFPQGTTLAKLARERVDWDSGTFFAALPEEREQAPHFDDDVGCSWSATVEAQSEFLNSVLANPENAAIFQETMAEISDEGMQNQKGFVTYGAEIYWYLDGRSFPADWREEDGWPGSPRPSMVFFFTVGWEPDKKEITEDDLRHVVKTLVGVAVGAWEEDSFVLWWRNGVSRPWKREGRPIQVEQRKITPWW